MKLRHAELVTSANPRLPGKPKGVSGVVSSALLGHLVILLGNLQHLDIGSDASAVATTDQPAFKLDSDC